MKRFILGVLVGYVLAVAASMAATDKKPIVHYALNLWTGEGARPGLYRWQPYGAGKTGQEIFYECKLLGPAKITPPPPSTP